MLGWASWGLPLLMDRGAAGLCCAPSGFWICTSVCPPSMQMSTCVTLSLLPPHVSSWVGTVVPTAIQQPLGIEGTACTIALELVASPQGLSPAQRVLVATSWER